MFCPYCGNNCGEGAAFCPNCGQPLQAPAAPQPPVNEYQVPAASYQPPVNEYQAPAAPYQAPVNEYQAPAAPYQPPVNAYPPQGAPYGQPVREQQPDPYAAPAGSAYYPQQYAGAPYNQVSPAEQEAPKKKKGGKKKTGLIIGVIAAVAVIAVVVCGFIFGWFGGGKGVIKNGSAPAQTVLYRAEQTVCNSGSFTLKVENDGRVENDSALQVELGDDIYHSTIIARDEDGDVLFALYDGKLIGEYGDWVLNIESLQSFLENDAKGLLHSAVSMYAPSLGISVEDGNKIVNKLVDAVADLLKNIVKDGKLNLNAVADLYDSIVKDEELISKVKSILLNIPAFSYSELSEFRDYIRNFNVDDLPSGSDWIDMFNDMLGELSSRAVSGDKSGDVYTVTFNFAKIADEAKSYFMSNKKVRSLLDVSDEELAEMEEELADMADYYVGDLDETVTIRLTFNGSKYIERIEVPGEEGAIIIDDVGSTKPDTAGLDRLIREAKEDGYYYDNFMGLVSSMMYGSPYMY
ncbi:MAG: hypothetical protein IK104_03840 [Clostridia bacterium]|nr:hypothetical protein [Clostridia bacterium]